MQRNQYMDLDKLRSHVNNGLIDIRSHRTLPLQIYTFLEKVVFENAWDEITTRCRGLIVAPDEEIVARPFEKFFNIDTANRPQTHIENLPTTQPIVTEKLDGSLGILWQYEGQSGIATKGSFHSDQAEWATKWYHKFCINAQWPLGYTPIFEILAESVQHHVVHYYGVEQLVLLALINNETGEEADYNTLYHWANINGLVTVEIFNKTLDEVIKEDRPNKEGYVLSWTRPGQPPLKVKVKHENFLALQRVVHAATPKAILQCLKDGDTAVLNTWINHTNEPIGRWVQGWMARFNFKYGEVLVKSNRIYNGAMHAGIPPESRKDFALYVKEESPLYAPVCFAMLDGKDHEPIIWKIVEQAFEKELATPFTTEAQAA